MTDGQTHMSGQLTISRHTPDFENVEVGDTFTIEMLNNDGSVSKRIVGCPCIEADADSFTVCTP